MSYTNETSDLIAETAEAVFARMQPTPKNDPQKFDKLANAIVDYLNSQGRYPLFFKGVFYLYDGRRYVEEKELDGIVRSWMRANNRGQSNNTVGNVSPIIENLARKPASQFGEMPFFAVAGEARSGMSKPGNVIAFQNGLLDITAVEQGLLAHSPKWVSTVCLPFDFLPEAECPSWTQFLDQVYEGDREKIRLLQEWFGYCLTHCTAQQKLLFLTGVSRSGKGTIMRTLLALVGDDCGTAYDLNLLPTGFGLMQLLGKLVAIVGELELGKNEKRRALQMLNSIVGQDAVSIDRKFKEPLSVYLPTKFIVACNEMSTFVDPCGALAARALILEHNVSFAGREDLTLESKLKAEISGIANWALDGLSRLNSTGRFSEPVAMQKAISRFRRDNSDTLAFIQDCLVVYAGLNPGNLEGVALATEAIELSKEKLEIAYRDWCVENNKDPEFNWLGRRLRAILPKLDYNRSKKRYDGIALLTDWQKSGAQTVAKPVEPELSVEEVNRFFAEMGP